MENNGAIIAYNASRLVRRFTGKTPCALCDPLSGPENSFILSALKRKLISKELYQ